MQVSALININIDADSDHYPGGVSTVVLILEKAKERINVKQRRTLNKRELTNLTVVSFFEDRSKMISNNKNARPMKTNVKPILIVILALLMIPAFAQVPYKSKSVKLTVNGTSSLHDWESEVTKVDWIGSFLVASNEVNEVADVIVKIPVTSIKSTKGKIMDNKTYEAFKSDKNPYIIFKMNKSQITGGNGAQTIKADGALTMAGKTKQITLTVNVKTLSNGDLQLTGSYTMNMRDYSMEPPTAMMGAIKVGEEVTVKFDLTVTDTNELSN